jgi:hypothetical protein
VKRGKDRTDYPVSFITWYQVAGEQPPPTMFRLGQDRPKAGSCGGGLVFHPGSQGVLMLDTTQVTHSAMCPTPEAHTREEEWQRGGMLASAFSFNPDTQKRQNDLTADAIATQEAGKQPQPQVIVVANPSGAVGGCVVKGNGTQEMGAGAVTATPSGVGWGVCVWVAVLAEIVLRVDGG